ncbi:hypothetical protein Lalb_Chr15g0076281 [Lupinus albus]|uniref:Uncharacterized protein n=1 Tax=Lupinus albus TaxID=3870 RepID=A0A6A4PDZ7_LUPAL|nr:hypothetical protein Lalb_Chr15g0076281 [Lupinus albus]
MISEPAEVVLDRANLPSDAEEYWTEPILHLGMDKEEQVRSDYTSPMEMVDAAAIEEEWFHLGHQRTAPDHHLYRRSRTGLHQNLHTSDHPR